MALSSFLILIFLDNSKEKQEYSSYPFFAQCNGIIHPFSFPSSTHLHHLLLSLAVLRALITEERKRCLHRQAISKCQCRTSITSVDAMKKEAASMLVQPVRAVLLLLLLRDLRVLLGDALLLLPLK
ncbi:hypothetical protein EUGRSUZ_C04141 [Eucalyptus grandis]|uniref:Uncharacterized protein n=2 Tax=Eucalyptus grandis TaxID=71139 RepID=A0ACC3LJR1_EUCGR|nr:hypothetical protein EUGRSUZ_C04141 [Eucalyptus grandis]